MVASGAADMWAVGIFAHQLATGKQRAALQCMPSSMDNCELNIAAPAAAAAAIQV
jgi:hypothetical protein